MPVWNEGAQCYHSKKEKHNTAAEVLISMASVFMKHKYEAATTKIIPRDYPEHGTQKGISYLSSEDLKRKRYFLLSAQRFNCSHFKFFKRLGAFHCRYHLPCPCCPGEKCFPFYPFSSTTGMPGSTPNWPLVNDTSKAN